MQKDEDITFFFERSIRKDDKQECYAFLPNLIAVTQKTAATGPIFFVGHLVANG